MRFLIRNLLPFCYFQTTRLNSLRLAIYHLLIEWIPTVLLTVYFNPHDSSKLIELLLSYVGFISIYEIGYIANDFFSERFEKDPRGRLDGKSVDKWVVGALIVSRLFVFAGVAIVLHVGSSTLWWAFYAGLTVTFALHNIWHTDNRLSSFYGLSVFRFLAPLLIVVPTNEMTVLVGAVMLYYSLFRTISYGAGKGLVLIGKRETFRFKAVHYVNLLPLSVLLAVIFESFLPIYFCIYYLILWGLSYLLIRKQPTLTRKDL